MYTVAQTSNGTAYGSRGDSLTDLEISNMINVLANPELAKLFTEEEKLMVQMAIKTNIATKAQNVLFPIANDKKDEIIRNDEQGLKFR